VGDSSALSQLSVAGCPLAAALRRYTLANVDCAIYSEYIEYKPEFSTKTDKTPYTENSVLCGQFGGGFLYMYTIFSYTGLLCAIFLEMYLKFQGRIIGYNVSEGL
jgi:hypothetical protein